MNLENDIIVDGKISSTENIQSKPVVLPVTIGATTLADQVLDWSKSDTYILDLNAMDLTGGGTTSKLILIEGNTENVRNRIIIRQNNTAPPNHVAFTLEAYDTVAQVTAQTVVNAATLTNDINVAGKTIIIDLEWWNGEFRTSSSNYIETTDYVNNFNISDGDSYNVALDKLDAAINAIAPAKAPLLDDDDFVVLTWDDANQPVTGYKLLSTGATIDNMTFVDPILHIKEFDASNTGTTVVDVDGTPEGTIDNTTFAATLPYTQTNIATALTKRRFNNLNNAFDLMLSLQGANAIPVSSTEKTINVTSDGVNNDFKFRQMLAPTQAGAPTLVSLSCTVIPTANFICGIPVVRAGHNITASVTFKDISYFDGIDGCYGSTMGRISAPCINTFTVGSLGSAAMMAAAPDSPALSANTAVLNDHFEENLQITAENYVDEIGVAGTSAVLQRPTEKLIVDSRTDQSLFSIDHTKPLTDPANTDKPLVLGGIVQYPSTDYSDAWNGSTAQGGLDYTVISNDRYIELTTTVTNKSRIKLSFTDQNGFSNSGIEANAGYGITVTRSDKLADTYDGNKAYVGYGVVQDSEGVLDVAASTMSDKLFTFGEVINTVVTVRITLSSGSNHKFNQYVSLTEIN